jgi:micrococcal nuclease
MKAFLALAIIMALLAASIGALWPYVTNSATLSGFVGTKFITKVVDGDTVIAQGESIRLLGIDTDERGYPCYSAAKERLEELVLDKEVTLEADVTDKDQYGRYLRYLWLNGTNINLLMVKEGLAVARFSPENIKYKAEIVAAEAAARAADIGCKWS